MTNPEHTPAQPAAKSRKSFVIGLVILALIGIVLSVWMALSGLSPAADQQLKAFITTKPEVVSIAGTNAPVITADDVIPAFFALPDFATPAEARMAIAPLFDNVTPRQVWLFANTGWAADTQVKDLEALIADLKGRGVTVVMILPPQGGETEDSTLDALASLANAQSVTFLDYHDADKLGEPLCALEDDDADASMQNEQLATSLATQQMLLHMAVNAPVTRAELKLADIGARIEKMKAEAKCAPVEGEATEAPAAVEDTAAPVDADTVVEDAPTPPAE